MKDCVELSEKHYTLNSDHPLYALLTLQTGYTNIVFKGVTRSVRRLYSISYITENPVVMKSVIDFLAGRYRAMGEKKPTHILGVPGWGYIIAAPLAMALGIPFVPLTVGQLSENQFVTEGEDKPPHAPLSIRSGALPANARVVIFDDQILTGETAIAAMDCAVIGGAEIVEFASICDLAQMGGIKHIHAEKCYKDVPVLTLFRLNNSGDVLFPKKMRSRL